MRCAVSERDVRRFVADLLRGRRPRRFRVQDGEVEEVRTAIMLRAARQGSGAPREEFVTDLHRRLAAELARDEQKQNPLPSARPRAAANHGRRRFVQAASIAASAAAVGAGVDHVLTRSSPASGGGDAVGDQSLMPNAGQWRTVAASVDLPEGGVQGFDLGTVIGFVARSGGQLGAVSGVCTHLGCRLALDAAARRLDCPCHNASFALGGQLLHHQLAVAPRALPHLQVREVDETVQVFVPPAPSA
jgi:cytochrome b6-f complex iron-sulfur subunit